MFQDQLAVISGLSLKKYNALRAVIELVFLIKDFG